MSRSARIVAIAVAGPLPASPLRSVASGSTVADLAVLTAACVIGELVELRPAGRAPLPLSLAVVIVLVRAATPVQFVIVVVAARGARDRRCAPNPAAVGARLVVAAERITEALAAGAAYRVVIDDRDRQRHPAPSCWAR